MYIKIPLKNKRPIGSKVQAIKYIKNRSKRYAKHANKTSTVRYVINMHKFYATKRVSSGIYTELYPGYGDLINISNEIKVHLNSYFSFKSGDSYGVCDDLLNFKEVFDEELSTIPEKVFVTLTPIHKKDQSDWGGWRWHKWGDAIGVKQPTTEYLYDEPDIETVWLYHIYVIKD